MDLNGCIGIMQGFLENSPVIVLGSGASVSYGLPSMQQLAESIKSDSLIRKDPEYASFCSKIDSFGLEYAVDNTSLQPDTVNMIRLIAWDTVNIKDWEFFDNYSTIFTSALKALFEKVIAPTPNKAVIVTTNYDRLAEYAADSIGATTVTGFEGSLIRKFELPSSLSKTRRVRTRERVVSIWKVHGSLDWFNDATGEIRSFPLSKSIPKECKPLIVPPGKNKYSSTHEEPYRTIIAEADTSFTEAGSYLCIGYGFNDEHIQPKLLAQIAKGKPIVILARTMTDSCRKLIIDAGIKKYMIFERATDTQTTVYGNGWKSVYDGQYWLLDEFIKIW
ncbi:MAG: SIR2 family protein [Christensenella sp.]|nr:SIR2 family protein [Christensenella sp.]